MNNNDSNNIIDDTAIKPKFITQGFKKFPKYTDIYDEEGNYHIDETNLYLLKNLAEIVCYKHFKVYCATSLDKEELVEVALFSMIERIAEGRFDPTKGIIKNYLYTAARNGITNYVYHFKNANKEIVSDTLPESQHINNSIKIVNKKMLLDFFKSVGRIYRVPTNDIAWKLYKEGFPIEQQLITTKTITTSEYKLNKVYIKFINYYKKVI